MRFCGMLIVLLGAGLTAPVSHAEPADTVARGSISRTPPRMDPSRPVTQPDYPASLADARIEGDIILDFHVRADGSVDAASIKVSKSTGAQALDQSAVNEAARWIFLPATENGQPVGSEHQFRVVFDVEKARSGSAPMRMDAEDFPGNLEGETGSYSVPMNMD